MCNFWSVPIKCFGSSCCVQYIPKRSNCWIVKKKCKFVHDSSDCLSLYLSLSLSLYLSISLISLSFSVSLSFSLLLYLSISLYLPLSLALPIYQFDLSLSLSLSLLPLSSLYTYLSVWSLSLSLSLSLSVNFVSTCGTVLNRAYFCFPKWAISVALLWQVRLLFICKTVCSAGTLRITLLQLVDKYILMPLAACDATPIFKSAACSSRPRRESSCNCYAVLPTNHISIFHSDFPPRRPWRWGFSGTVAIKQRSPYQGEAGKNLADMHHHDFYLRIFSSYLPTTSKYFGPIFSTSPSKNNKSRVVIGNRSKMWSKYRLSLNNSTVDSSGNVNNDVSNKYGTVFNEY